MRVLGRFLPGRRKRPDFDAYRKALREHGFRETDSSRAGPFGSWLIVFDDPPGGVVWDGEDGWLIVEQKTAGAWADRWISRDETGHTADAVAAQLTSLG